MKFIVLIAMTAVIAGCANINEMRQDASAGLVGCPPREIAISNNERLTWTAACRGKVFQCSTGATSACTPQL